MAPSPIPAPLPPWAKAVLYLAPLAFQLGVELADYFFQTDEPADLTWRRFSFVIDNTASLDPSDVYTYSHDVAKIRNSTVHDDWSQADYDQVEAQLLGIAQVWSSRMSSSCKYTACNVYKMGFNGYETSKPFSDSGPPVAVYPLSIAGAGAGQMAPQVASSVTEEVVRRRNWGRFYLPVPTFASLEPAGRLIDGEVDAVINEVHSRYVNLQSLEFFPVVPVTSVDKNPARGLYTVTGVRMDDTADVIRRRRYAQPTHRVTLPVVP